jgi:HSP20 family protein
MVVVVLSLLLYCDKSSNMLCADMLYGVVEVTIELKNSNILLVAGEREAKHEAGDVKEGHKWHRIERSYGKFSRAFQLPDNSDLDNISASFENGELKVTVPKSMSARHAKNRRIAIQ